MGIDVKKVGNFITNTPIIKSYFNEIRNTNKGGTPEERIKRERSLFERIKKGDNSAREELIKDNLLFVASVAKKFANNDKEHLLDLINEGNIGMIEAIDKFDPDFGVIFCSYASHYIARNIREYLMRENLVKQTNFPKIKDIINRIKNEFIQREEREPTTTELLELINEQSDANIIEESDLYTLVIDSLDSKEEYEGEESVSNTEIEFNKRYCEENDVHSYIQTEQNDKLVSELMCVLNPIERYIVQLYYGIDCIKEHTYYEISQISGYSAERIRQILEEAKLVMRLYYQSKKENRIAI